MDKNNSHIDTSQTQKPATRVLVAPLDWGLGHTTRMIPVIKTLLQAGCIVWLAGNKKQKAILQTEFPELPFYPLKGYNVKYSRDHRYFTWKLLLQLPALSKLIYKEHHWLQNFISTHQPDLVISDNRYGLYNKNVHSIFVTHQLYVKSPLGKIIDNIIQKCHYTLIEKFNACWVPDQQVDGLGGDLSHPQKFPSLPVHYTGWLSRFSPLQNEEPADFILVSLSGPEPQRTILEQLVLEQIKNIDTKFILVRGLPGNDEKLFVAPHVTIYNHLPAEAFNHFMQQARLIISRCGYSTVMDIACLRKPSILVPTPGQTEQEYLADYLMQKGFAFTCKQSQLDIKNAIEKATHFNYQLPVAGVNKLPALIVAALQQVQQATTSDGMDTSKSISQS